MLKMFEPSTFPTERAAPSVDAAITATVNSGKVVDIAINVKPMDVFPSCDIAETLRALVIAKLLAQFKARKEKPITTKFSSKSAKSDCTIHLSSY